VPSGPQHVAYIDGDTIDWIMEDSLEKRRKSQLRKRPGWRGALFPSVDAAKMWTVLVFTGVFTGIIGAWLDVSTMHGCESNMTNPLRNQVLVKWSVGVIASLCWIIQ
jgi:hypothetical protein